MLKNLRRNYDWKPTYRSTLEHYDKNSARTLTWATSFSSKTGQNFWLQQCSNVRKYITTNWKLRYTSIVHGIYQFKVKNNFNHFIELIFNITMNWYSVVKNHVNAYQISSTLVALTTYYKRRKKSVPTFDRHRSYLSVVLHRATRSLFNSLPHVSDVIKIQKATRQCITFQRLPSKRVAAVKIILSKNQTENK